MAVKNINLTLYLLISCVTINEKSSFKCCFVLTLDLNKIDVPTS